MVMVLQKKSFSPVLSKLVSSLKEAESLSGEHDMDFDFLQQLLESKELNALVNVHTKVAKIGKDDRLAPLLSSSMQVRIDILNQKVLSICI